jgi:hypothetical protein
VRGGVTLSGRRATVARPDPVNPARTILLLDGAQPLERINPNVDTIYLPADTATAANRPGPVYRVLAVNAAAREVTVGGVPDLDGGASAWEIPAGVSGAMPALQYDLGPHHAPVPPPLPPERLARGFDHYDGALFIVYRGRIVGPRIFRWSSYTSRDYGPWSGANWQERLSSVQGNARYYYASYRSGDHFKNYTFGVIDAAPGQNGLQPAPPHNRPPPPPDPVPDTVAQARFYFGTPSPPAPGGLGANLDLQVISDPNGKTEIRFHRGSVAGRPGTGSAGCLVSPDFVDMRTELVRMFELDYAEFYGPGAVDGEVHKLLVHATTNPGSENLWNGVVGGGLTAANWNDKLAGIFWLIRPDERSLGP